MKSKESAPSIRNFPQDFDVKALRERLTLGNKFILEMCRLIPMQHLPASDENLVEEDKKSKPGIVFGSEKRATSLEELHKKLQDLKGKKLQYKDRLLKKGVKNKIDKKRKREERKLKKNLLKGNKDPAKLMRDVKQITKPAESTAPVFNKEGHIVFNKFDFAENLSSKSKNKRKQEEKDPRKILKKLNKQDEKLKKLEEVGDTEKITLLKEKKVWNAAIQKAQGIKVKDDPIMLMKSLKRKEQQKIRSAKKWKKREQEVEKKMEERQKKRTANIEERKRQNKTKKLKKLAKRGRVIPGYS